MSIEFEWDPNKAASNKRKHGVSFETASRAFSDPNCVQELERHVESEERWQTTGMAGDQLLILVVHTNFDFEDVEIVRIISARLATHRERRRYEENYDGSL